MIIFAGLIRIKREAFDSPRSFSYIKCSSKRDDYFAVSAAGAVDSEAVSVLAL